VGGRLEKKKGLEYTGGEGLGRDPEGERRIVISPIVFGFSRERAVTLGDIAFRHFMGGGYDWGSRGRKRVSKWIGCDWAVKGGYPYFRLRRRGEIWGEEV